MSRLKIVEVVGGTTIRLTFRNDDGAASVICSALLSGSETLVSSVVAQSSGTLNGVAYYYALHNVPRTNAWYINEWLAFISPNTYRNLQYVRATAVEVD